MNNRTIHGDPARHSTSGRSSLSAPFDVTRIDHNAWARNVRSAKAKHATWRRCVMPRTNGLTGRSRDGAGRAHGVQHCSNTQEPIARAAGGCRRHGACVRANVGALKGDYAWPTRPGRLVPWP